MGFRVHNLASKIMESCLFQLLRVVWYSVFRWNVSCTHLVLAYKTAVVKWNEIDVVMLPGRAKMSSTSINRCTVFETTAGHIHNEEVMWKWGIITITAFTTSNYGAINAFVVIWSTSSICHWENGLDLRFWRVMGVYL